MSSFYGRHGNKGVVQEYFLLIMKSLDIVLNHCSLRMNIVDRSLRFIEVLLPRYLPGFSISTLVQMRILWTYCDMTMLILLLHRWWRKLIYGYLQHSIKIFYNIKRIFVITFQNTSRRVEGVPIGQVMVSKELRMVEQVRITDCVFMHYLNSVLLIHGTVVTYSLNLFGVEMGGLWEAWCCLYSSRKSLLLNSQWDRQLQDLRSYYWYSNREFHSRLLLRVLVQGQQS